MLGSNQLMDKIQLPVKEVYFYLPTLDQFTNEQLNDPVFLSTKGGIVVWSALVYYYYKNINPNAKLVSKVPESGIIIFHPNNVSAMLRDENVLSNVVLVTALADGRERFKFSNFHLVQNQDQVDRKSYFLPLVPQPGIIKRDRSRQALIEKVAFKGVPQNLDARFKDQKWCEGVSVYGVSVSFDYSGEAWNNYSDVDLVLAVRSPRKDLWVHKPPSKLINAWIAESPALLGPEKAFRALRKSPLDYIEVQSPSDVFSAIKYLKENPSFYLEMIENGKERAKEHTAESICFSLNQHLMAIDKKTENFELQGFSKMYRKFFMGLYSFERAVNMKKIKLRKQKV